MVANARRDVYRIGQTALVDVHVYDKVTGQPQGDVDAGVFLDGRDNKWIGDASKTDRRGHALMRLR